MRNSVLIVLAVAALSTWIARAERAPRNAALAAPLANAAASDWVRTADGWEHRAALTAGPPTVAVQLHPGLLAAIQVGVSILVLGLFPGRAIPVPAMAPAHLSAGRHVRRGNAEPAVS